MIIIDYSNTTETSESSNSSNSSSDSSTSDELSNELSDELSEKHDDSESSDSSNETNSDSSEISIISSTTDAKKVSSNSHNSNVIHNSINSINPHNSINPAHLIKSKPCTIKFNIHDVTEIEYTREPCIRINNPRLGPAKYYDEDFVDEYNDYCHAKIEKNELECDPTNNLQALEAMNALYIDIDGGISDTVSDVFESNLMIGSKFLEIFISSNSLSHFDAYKFVPKDEYPRLSEDSSKFKMGFHGLIFTDHTYSKDTRAQMYDTTRRAILNDPSILKFFSDNGLDLTSANYSEIFDEQPLKSASCMLPFAMKFASPGHHARAYILVNPEEITFKHRLIIPSVHTESTKLTDSSVEEIDSDSDVDCLPEEMKEIIRGTVFRETLAFIDSLRYLCPEHIFWRYISDHNLRQEKIIRPLFHWLVLQTTTQNPFTIKDCRKELEGNEDEEGLPLLKYIARKLAQSLLPLTIMTNEDEITNTYAKMYNHIYGVCVNSYYIRGIVDDDHRSHYSIIVDALTMEASIVMKDKTEAQMIQPLKSWLVRKGMDAKAELSKFLRRLRKVSDVSKEIYSQYSRFVRMIMGGFTEEIRPFDHIITNTDIKNGLRYTENLRGSCTFDQYRQDPFRFEEYEETIKRWLRMFMCVMYYNSPVTFVAIRKATSALVLHFVRRIFEGDAEIPIFYNIRQTPISCQFSWNQWIPDYKSELINDWFVTIYTMFIEDELQTDAKLTFITGFMSNLRTLQPTDLPKQADIKPLEDIKAEIKKLKNNILITSTHGNNFMKLPEKCDITNGSRYHPCRNCIIEFVTEDILDREDVQLLGKQLGDFIVHYNNFDRYMMATTNVFYNENYTYANSVYKKVNKIFEEIYIYPDQIKYMKMIFAQTLHSIGARDQVYQFHGTGAEGKSLINNAISMMLGYGNEPIATKFTSGYKYDVCCKDRMMRIVGGLATSMDVRYMMRENMNGHDSGGTIELRDRRFCSVAEPNVEAYGSSLNVSFCKRVTGESIISGRRIRKDSQTFIPKVLLIIQTNDLLGYTEDNDAVTRRFAVVNHEAKFVTEALMTKEKRGCHSIRHKADPSLTDHFKSDPAYWEALFQVLLPYAQEFIRKGYKGLSDIPKPEKMLKWFEISRLKSTGLVGWFAKNFVEVDGKVISAKNIIDKIISQDKIGKESGDPILDASMVKLTADQRRTRIANVIAARFGNMSLFKLRPEFWNGDMVKNKKEEVEIDGELMSIQDLEEIGITCDEDVDKWFEHNALSNLAEITDMSGAYVIDHAFVKSDKKNGKK